MDAEDEISETPDWATGEGTEAQTDGQMDQKECEEDSGFEGTRKHYFRGSRPHSTPMTLRWLEDNYETADGVCIPRSTLYLHYLDFCEDNDTNPVNAASFGKIIRQQFPQITTRRLGTRGQSKYHYYGIGVKESSPYYDVMYSAKGVQTLGEGKKDTTKQVVAYSPRSKLGTLLPPFPDLNALKLSSEVDDQKVMTFVMMYRTHCQRILDTVIRANFDEVQNFLHHFWQGMPPHITPILGTRTLVHLVGVCDSILYKAIANVLMPTVLQPFPESLTQVIRKFASQLEDWLAHALSGMPTELQELKLDLSRRFSQVLRRQLSVNHLVQAARTVVNSPDVMSQMLSDWMLVDVSSIVQQTLYTMDDYTERDRQAIFNLCSDFEKLLDEQAPLESYVDWLDGMVDSCVIKQSSASHVPLKAVSRQFLFIWTCFGTRVIRDLTLQSAGSFGSFHLLHLMLDDYVLYRIESLQADDRAKNLLGMAKGQKDNAESSDDVILPDSSKVPLPLGPFITSPALAGYRCASILDEHIFDYESHSDCFTSEEDDEDDEEDDDVDESFLQPPFAMMGNLALPSPLSKTSNYHNLTAPFAHHPSFSGNHGMRPASHHPQQQPHQQQQQQQHPHHPFPFPGHSHHQEFPLQTSHGDNYFIPQPFHLNFDYHNKTSPFHYQQQQQQQQQQHQRQSNAQQQQQQQQQQQHCHSSHPSPPQCQTKAAAHTNMAPHGSSSHTSGSATLPMMHHPYPEHYAALPAGERLRDGPNPSETSSRLPEDTSSVDRKPGPAFTARSRTTTTTPPLNMSRSTPLTQFQDMGQLNHYNNHHHNQSYPPSFVTPEGVSSISAADRGGIPEVTKGQTDLKGEFENKVKDPGRPYLTAKEGFWGHTPSTASFIN